MKPKSMWSFKLSTAALVLIPAAIGINYIGKLFASLLKLPLWLDSIGTVLASMLAGPIVGALSGVINNIIYGLTADPVSFVYALTSLAIGLVVGVMAYKGWISSFGKAVIIGLVVALTAAIVSTPLNIIYWGGQTGNLWGDALFATLMANHSPQWIASFLDEFVVDLPDKVATIMIGFALYKALPNNLRMMYSYKQETTEL